MMGKIAALAIGTMLSAVAARSSDAAGPECRYDGNSFIDASCASGGLIWKNGPGDAVVALQEGSYTVWMDGPGSMYLIGRNDYRDVRVTSKNGEGTLCWVPSDPSRPSFGPIVEWKDGPGAVRTCPWSNIRRLRGL